jgi:sulfatase maturation enzyme AslB (radical SAM superfamily)
VKRKRSGFRISRLFLILIIISGCVVCFATSIPSDADGSALNEEEMYNHVTGNDSVLEIVNSPAFVGFGQFLPLVSAGKTSADPGDVGKFLCRIFDRWIREDVGRIVIQIFDEAFRTIYGIPRALCTHRETCGDVAVLEHNGDVYACDHFTDTEHLMGNFPIW